MPEPVASAIPLINIAPIQTFLAQNHCILTPNNRLKNKILQAWGALQTSASWTAPRVMSLDEWLNQQWHNAAREHSHPLRACAEIPPLVRRRLWSQVLAGFEDTSPLIHPRQMAEQLDQAYSFLRLWQIDQSHFDSLGLGIDFGQLQAWIAAFEQRLQQLGLCTREQQLVALASLPAPSAAEPVLLVNADQLSPLYQTLLDRLSAGVQRLHTNNQPAAEAWRTACPDRPQEMQAAALWARAQLADNPHQRIGIVDPNLGQNRAALERVLNRVFEPGLHLPGQPRRTPPYNFSAGRPLSGCPIIHAALAGLAWAGGKSPEQAKQWLNLPFLGWDHDQPLRLWLSSQIAKDPRESVSAGYLRGLLSRAAEQDWLADLTALPLWQNWSEQLSKLPARQPGRHWARHFLGQLQAINWPGPRPLDSEEHQQVALFYQLLEQLAQADWLNQPLSPADALSWLSELCARQPFQPQTPESPLQLLGTLESAGLAFDRLWVMGMEDSQWPPAPQPNPLLPALLQRQQAMPHASSERELAYCQSLTRDYLHGARQVIFSYPERDGDRQLAASPLIQALPLLTLPPPPKPQWQPAGLEWIDTRTAPPVSARELTRLRGGAGLLQKQSRCPLAAFMALRLGASRPEPFSPGLDALSRGNLLHRALEFFWRANPTLPAPDATEQCIAAAVDAALAEQARDHNRQLLALEKQRLGHLLGGWLALERQRPGFTVLGLEQSLSFKLGPLPLSLRLDRIDEVDGQWLLIDYKSGQSTSKNWLGERLEEPQLPLYAVALSDQGKPVAAVSFAELRQKQQRLEGLGSHPLAPGIRAVDEKSAGLADWQALLAHWHHALLNLAEEVMEGHTAHRYSSRQSRDYLADLQPLLRTAEQQDLQQLQGELS